MPIGEFLAAARHRAGLSVAQVSGQTRIRETIIGSIETGDYSACGGDFYARGHIRAIAKAVGADPEPLIQEYDSLHRPRRAVSAVSLEELLSASAQVPLGRRVHFRPVLALALVAVVVAGFGLYRLLSGAPLQAAARRPRPRLGRLSSTAGRTRDSRPGGQLPVRSGPGRALTPGSRCGSRCWRRQPRSAPPTTCVHRAGGMLTGRDRSERFGTPGTAMAIEGAGTTGTAMAIKGKGTMGTAVKGTGTGTRNAGTDITGTGITGGHNRRLVTRL